MRLLRPCSAQVILARHARVRRPWERARAHSGHDSAVSSTLWPPPSSSLFWVCVCAGKRVRAPVCMREKERRTDERRLEAAVAVRTHANVVVGMGEDRGECGENARGDQWDVITPTPCKCFPRYYHHPHVSSLLRQPRMLEGCSAVPLAFAAASLAWRTAWCERRRHACGWDWAAFTPNSGYVSCGGGRLAPGGGRGERGGGVEDYKGTMVARVKYRPDHITWPSYGCFASDPDNNVDRDFLSTTFSNRRSWLPSLLCFTHFNIKRHHSSASSQPIASCFCHHCPIPVLLAMLSNSPPYFSRSSPPVPHTL